MRKFLIASVLLALAGFTTACNKEEAPKADPNWKPSSNPSDIVIPGQMKKGPGGPGAAAPATPGAPATPAK
jgi:hypothetical protein